MSKFELFYPVRPAKINQAFGNLNPFYKENGIDIIGHNGIDFFAPEGAPIYATHNGICYPGIDSKGGNGVEIRTEEEYDYQEQKVRFKTIYWHLQKADAVVKTGQKVEAGDLIGYADNTGLSTGPHLHFGLKPQVWDKENWIWLNPEQNNGYLGAISPEPFFNAYYAEDAQKVFTILNQIIDLLKSSIMNWGKTP